MAKMYKLILPHGQKEITIGMQYGNITFQHGQVVPESPFIKLFPDFFFEIPEIPELKPMAEVLEKWKPVIESETPSPIAELTPSPEQPVKRKAGRPFGSTTKNRK